MRKSISPFNNDQNKHAKDRSRVVEATHQSQNPSIRWDARERVQSAALLDRSDLSFTGSCDSSCCSLHHPHAYCIHPSTALTTTFALYSWAFLQLQTFFMSQGLIFIKTKMVMMMMMMIPYQQSNIPHRSLIQWKMTCVAVIQTV